MKLLPLLIALSVPALLFAQRPMAGEKLAAGYTQARADAVRQTNARYVQMAELVIKQIMQGGDLAKANIGAEWARRLVDNDETNDTEGILPDPNAQDRVVALQTHYLKDRADAILRVNRAYGLQVEASQRLAMQTGDLAAANTLAQLRARIEADSSTAGIPATGGDPLFSPEKQKKWKTVKGEWKWDGTKVHGEGNGILELETSLSVPFVAQFKFTPMKGLRESILFDKTGLWNAGSSTKFGIPAVNQELYLPYQHGTTYRCVFVCAKKQCELYVDGKLLNTGAGHENKVEKIKIICGDGWSPGTLEIQDLVILHGTDKVPAM